MNRIGIDLGGTKIAGVLLNAQGICLAQQRVDTPQGDYRATLNSIACLVSELEKQDSGSISVPATIGIGTPGSLSTFTGKMKNCNSTCLNQQNFIEDIEDVLGRAVRIANDANCFALSEAVDGAGSRASVVFGVILGTGVGGGVVVNKSLLNGSNAIAGEWGHNRLPAEAPRAAQKPYRACYCGRSDCIETYLCGAGMALSFQQLGGSQWLTAREIAQVAQQGDPTALQLLDVYAQQLAVSLGQVVNILDPEVIVLGGGLSNIASLYDLVPAKWSKTIFSDQVQTQLLPARYGDASGVRGAAWLWNNS